MNLHWNPARFDLNGLIRIAVRIALVSGVLVAGLSVWGRFQTDIAAARSRAAFGGSIVQTRCGLIEYQDVGKGTPMLVVHGAAGGHDQGLALAQPGVRVIAMSRFGYLRTPLPADASPAAQADAHACLLDALGVRRAAVVGVSAGAPSALQMAIRHPDRISALVLLVPLTYRPVTLAESTTASYAVAERVLMSMLGSDFLMWAMLRVAGERAINWLLATPSELLPKVSPGERVRVNTMLDNIMPLSARAEGLRNDAKVAGNLEPYALDTIRTPTLVISTRDDGFGTFASAQYTASRIAGAKFVGFEQGGHALIGHEEAIRQQVAELLATLPAK